MPKKKRKVAKKKSSTSPWKKEMDFIKKFNKNDGGTKLKKDAGF